MIFSIKNSLKGLFYVFIIAGSMFTFLWLFWTFINWEFYNLDMLYALLRGAIFLALVGFIIGGFAGEEIAKDNLK